MTTLEEFEASLRGKLIKPDDAEYDETRKIWNAMIDKKPALIAQCAGTSDVMRSVKYAREQKLPASVRSGGHHIAGNSLCDDGLLIDLSHMRTVVINPTTKRAYVQPGATLGDFDHETQAFGLATPVGINSTTGIAGLTLGAGFGWLTPKWGLTIDNLVSAHVITADGEFLKASENENPDLFWAIRGGGGNFGIVTQFEFKLHEFGPDVYCGLIAFPLEKAHQVLRKHREFTQDSPRDLCIWGVMRSAPPLPFLPESAHGKGMIALAFLYTGDPKKGEELTRPLFEFAEPLGHHVGVQPFTAFQQIFDPLLTPGARNYWKSHNFSHLDDEVLEIMVKYAGELPSSQCEVFLALVAGAANGVSSDAMAYSERDAKFVLNVHARWEEPQDDARCIDWTRRFFDEARPHAMGSTYINFMTADEAARVPSSYGSNYARLTALKQKYDPTNFFSTNQNIPPK